MNRAQMGMVPWVRRTSPTGLLRSAFCVISTMPMLSTCLPVAPPAGGLST
jgi:hypothetical protein